MHVCTRAQQRGDVQCVLKAPGERAVPIKSGLPTSWCSACFDFVLHVRQRQMMMTPVKGFVRVCVCAG